jgi:hypothetical protein
MSDYYDSVLYALDCTNRLSGLARLINLAIEKLDEPGHSSDGVAVSLLSLCKPDIYLQLEQLTHCLTRIQNKTFGAEIMTIERWDDDRLDRLAAATAENAAGITELRSAVANMLQVVEIHQRNFEAVVGEIRGLRAESRRILEHMFGPDANL